MKVLVVYGTNSGGTQVAAEVVAQYYENRRYEVRLCSADKVGSDDLAGYDLIVFGSCTWEQVTSKGKLEGQMQQHFLVLKEKLRTHEFHGKKFALFALGDISYTSYCAAAGHLEEMVKELKGEHIGPTLCINGFFADVDKHREQIRKWSGEIERLLSGNNRA